MRFSFFGKKERLALAHQLALLQDEVSFAQKYLHQLKSGNLVDDQLQQRASAGILTQDLMAFKEHLQNIAVEEHHRNWANEGLAKFAMLLRGDASDLSVFYHHLLSHLVKYVKANQGILFLVNEEDEGHITLDSVACYAYDKRKYIHKKIEIGEGLVGQAYLEKDLIYMTDVPSRYVEITSGLGHATARCLLLLPIMLNEKVHGVLELATFEPFKAFEVEFLKKLSENIASVVSSTKINQKTRQLLETSQLQAESMRAQEEELRQNMEELSSMQEDISRQLVESNQLREELAARESVFNETTILSETDQFGTIIFVNDKFCEVAKYRREELIGKPHNIVRHPDMPKEVFKLMWQTIKTGKVFRGIVKNRAQDGSHYWVDATIVPIFNKQGELVKYIGARYHIKDERLAVLLYQEQMERLGLNAATASLYN